MAHNTTRVSALLRHSLVLLCTAGGPALFAQSSTITGLITDPNGANIPEAPVTITNTATGVARRVPTNGQGYFTAPSLPYGDYSLGITVAGFRPVLRSGLHLDEGQVLRVDIKLELGVTVEQIVVSGAPPALETETSAQSTVVTSQRIVDLPLNGRNPFAFAALVPGVRPLGGFGGLSNSAYGDGRISIGGGSPSVNNGMVDGVAAENHTSGGIQIALSPDATQEFRIITRNASAEYGRTGGGIINFISKSGTNEFHGSVFEYLRNKSLNANDFFNNRSGSPKSPFTFNQFGATLGGPVIRNRTFFFVNWEAVRQRTGSRAFRTVPTALQRDGDFSQTRDAKGVLIPIYDPLSSSTARVPFAGNVIPRNQLNAVARAASAYYPNPTGDGDLYTGANNFFGVGSQAINKDILGGKFDHYFTPARRLAGRYTWDRTENVYPTYFGGTVADPSGAPAVYPRNSAVLTYTDTLSPTLILELRAGLNRFGIDRTPLSLGFDVTKIGMDPSVNSQIQIPLFPYFSMSDVSPIGQNQGDISAQRNNTWTAGGALTWLKGNHTLKFGAEQRIYQWNSVQGPGQFQLNFDRNFTKGPSPTVAATNGYGYASFLLGYAASGTLYRYNYPTYTTKNFAVYVQDDWKASPKLTLNLGLRYEYEGPGTDRYNAIANFDPYATNTVNGVPLTGSIIFPGTGGLGRGDRDAQKDNFGPRVGLAYQLLPHTVIRASYGIYYLPTTGIYVRLGSTGFESQTPYVGSTDGGITPSGSITNPFPNGIVMPSGTTLGAATGIGTNAAATLRSLKTGYSQQWDFNIQQQLGSWALELGYMGNRGSGLPASASFHYLPASARALGSSLLNQVANPYAALVRSGPLAQAKVPLATLLTTSPQYTAVDVLDSWAGSSYHAATVRLERRFSSGFSALLSYTFSKLLDDNLGNGGNGFTDSGSNSVQNWENRRAEKGVSTTFQPHRFTAAASYLLPFGKSGNRLYRAVVGGWQANVIASLMSGNVISVTANAPTYGGDRPNIAGDPSLDNPTVDRWLNRDAFTNIAAYTLGNGPRNLPRTLSQALINFDTSLFKEIPVRERYKLQFRAEAFNLANKTTLGNPNSNINSNSFGAITSLRTNTGPRQLQFALRLTF